MPLATRCSAITTVSAARTRRGTPCTARAAAAKRPSSRPAARGSSTASPFSNDSANARHDARRELIARGEPLVRRVGALLTVRKKRLQRTVTCCLTTAWLAGCADGGYTAYDCSVFPPAATSPYVLPWMIGTTYRALPHAARSTNAQKYAVDVPMPIGTPILASRDGIVVRVEESFVDGDNVPLHENYIFVEHEDGTVARYA